MAAQLQYRNPEGRVLTLSLPAEGAMVGRTEQCMVRTTDSTVSGRHCRFLLRDGQWHVEDLGSTNGTALNQKRLEKRKAVAIRPGDVIRCGAFQVRFTDEISVEEAPTGSEEAAAPEEPAVAEEAPAPEPAKEEAPAGLPQPEPAPEAAPPAPPPPTVDTTALAEAEATIAALREQLAQVSADRDRAAAAGDEAEAGRQRAEEMRQTAESALAEARGQIQAREAELAERLRAQPAPPPPSRQLAELRESEANLEAALQRVTEERNQLTEALARAQRQVHRLRAELDRLRLLADLDA